MTEPALPLLVVVTGAPAAGKTTVARRLARELGLPLVAKDDITEALYDTLGSGDRAWSRRLGVATFEVQFLVVGELLAAGCSLVAEANFSRAEPFRALPPARLVQVLCRHERARGRRCPSCSGQRVAHRRRRSR